MVSGRIIEKLLLQRKSERPLRGFLRNLLYSFGASSLIFIVYIFVNIKPDFNFFLGIFIISCGLFFLGWGVERLWYSTISKMMNNPFSLIAFLTRIPFWFIAGGIGFSFPLLFANKYELLYIFKAQRLKKLKHLVKMKKDNMGKDYEIATNY